MPPTMHIQCTIDKKNQHFWAILDRFVEICWQQQAASSQHPKSVLRMFLMHLWEVGKFFARRGSGKGAPVKELLPVLAQKWGRKAVPNEKKFEKNFLIKFTSK